MPEHLVTTQRIAELEELKVEHQFNSNAIRFTKNLGSIAGLTRLGIHQVRLNPGRDSTTHHYHEADEEFLYIISGKGIAKIGTQEFEVSAGDFMGFPSPSLPHSMHNNSDEDLVYLMGGERWPVDVVRYPDQKKTMIKSNGSRSWSSDSHLADLTPRN